jgi:hypothetical protein
LEHALEFLCPSHLARELLSRALKLEPETQHHTAEAAPIEESRPERDPLAGTPLEQTAGPVGSQITAAHEVEDVEGSEEAPTSLVAESPEVVEFPVLDAATDGDSDIEHEPSITGSSASPVERSRTEGVVADSAPLPVTDESEPLAPEEAIAEIEVLEQRIQAAEPDVAMMAHDLQRLFLAAWICRARSLEERCVHEEMISSGVRQIAGRLGRYAKDWWPGTVVALRLKAIPADVAAELGFSEQLASWEAAAQSAESLLGELLSGPNGDA